MTRYCGEIRNVSGTTGGGYLATGQLDPNDLRGETMSVAMGVTLGLLTGVGLAWLSAVRLFLAWREMQQT